MRLTRQRAGRSALVLAVLSISWGSILVRLCDSPPTVIAFHRLFLATIFLAPWGLRGALAIDRGTLLRILPAGVLLALHFASWIASLSHTSIAASTVLVSTQPVVSALLSWWFLSETPSRSTRAAILVALSGIVLLARGDLGLGGSHLEGDLLALVGAVCAAAYLVIGRTARARAPLASYLFLVNGTAALCCGALALVEGRSLRPSSGRDWGWLVLMALVPHLLGHGALNWAVRRLRAYVVHLAVLGEPVLASLYALAIFHDAPPPALYPGAILIGAGVALAVYFESRPCDAEPPENPMPVASDPGAARL